jgi:ribA/ribD-fused uncharacterized protein
MKEQFTFFWSGVFSQWAKTPFTDANGITFNCAEQYMMWSKAKLFSDEETAEQILKTSNPRDQKALGRKVKGFVDEVWKDNAKPIVRNGNIYKFTQNFEARKALLATVGTTLVEASPYDRLWGIGLTEDDERALDRSTWRGENWLGEILTEVRDVIIREELND